MKKFDNFNDAFKWTNKVIDKGRRQAISTVTEEVYKDSEDYTYERSNEMYKSGSLHSDFNNGVIIERTPYVRRRYYEGGKPGKDSPKKAGPHWFERCISDNKEKYKKMVVISINKEKDG